MDDWPLPTLVDFSHVSNGCTISNIPATATAEVDRSSQLSRPLPEQVVRYHMAGGRAHTDKKESKIFLIYRENQMGSGAKSYMRNGFLLYEEIHKYFHHI
jgi:hypothetical protein